MKGSGHSLALLNLLTDAYPPIELGQQRFGTSYAKGSLKFARSVPA